MEVLQCYNPHRTGFLRPRASYESGDIIAEFRIAVHILLFSRPSEFSSIPDSPAPQVTPRIHQPPVPGGVATGTMR
jgi:hypothetical protein